MAIVDRVRRYELKYKILETLRWTLWRHGDSNLSPPCHRTLVARFYLHPPHDPACHSASTFSCRKCQNDDNAMQSLFPLGGTWHPEAADWMSAAGERLGEVLIPVTGASMSSMVFSWRRMAAPSLMIRRATASSTRPSLVRCALSRSTRGFPSQSNTSFNVRRWLRGKGTAEDRAQAHGDI